MASLRLLHVDLSVNVSIEECVFHIQLDDRIFPDISYSQERLGSGVITYGGKDLEEVFPLNLSKALGHQSCFELVKATVSVGLYTEWFLTRWEFREFPCSSLEQCLHLCVHYFLPLVSIWAGKSFL